MHFLRTINCFKLLKLTVRLKDCLYLTIDNKMYDVLD